MNYGFPIFCFIPRSGSTLLTVLLNQHPDVFVLQTSNLIKFFWDSSSAFHEKDSAFTSETFQKIKRPFLHKIYQSYYSCYTDKSFIIEKNRFWSRPGNLEMYKDIYGDYPKGIMLYRDVAECVASGLSIHQKSIPTWSLEEGGTNLILDHVENMKKIYYSDLRDKMLWINYKDLINDPGFQLNRILNYLNLSYFNFNLGNLENTDIGQEISSGINNLHTVKKEIISDDYHKEVLGNHLFNFYKQFNFWEH